jgi:hypothetical protein
MGCKAGYQKVLGPQGSLHRPNFPNANLSACNVYSVNPWKPLTVFCHRAHALLCKDMMIRKFNREPNFMDQPGMYDMHFLAHQEQSDAGHQLLPANTSSTMNQLRQKHLSITRNMVVLSTSVLHEFDTSLLISEPVGLTEATYLYKGAKNPPGPYP